MELPKEKKGHFLYHLFCPKEFFFFNICFISMYSILNTLSEYKHLYISKNITSYTFLLVFIIVGSLQRILNLVCLRFCLLVNITQSYLIFHFRINCMLSLVILSFPCLILVFSWLVVAISYSWFYSVNLGLFLI